MVPRRAPDQSHLAPARGLVAMAPNRFRKVSVSMVARS
jgi:hypothetical protein